MSKSAYKLFLLFSFSIFGFSGCFPEDGCDQSPNLSANETQLQSDIEAIDAYLSENDIDAELHSSGIRYVIHDNGDGRRPTLCDNVTVSYEGRLMSDGSVFDGTDQTVAFGLSRLITGWQIGIPQIEEGGSITLYIPSVYGYGASGSGDDIPPNANLIFDINLAKVF